MDSDRNSPFNVPIGNVGFKSPYLNLDPKILLGNQESADYIYLGKDFSIVSLNFIH